MQICPCSCENDMQTQIPNLRLSEEKYINKDIAIKCNTICISSSSLSAGAITPKRHLIC